MKEAISIAERIDIPPDVASSSNEYATRFSGETGGYFLEVQDNALKKLLSQIPPTKSIQRVLDLGGGHCQLVERYLSCGYHVYMQGSDERSFLRPISLGYNNSPYVHFITHHIEELHTIPDQSYDLVSGIRLMAHIPDWETFLNHCLRISKYGIIFDYANLYSINLLSPLLFHLKKRVEKNTRPFFCHTSRNIKNLLHRSGAARIIQEPQFVFPMGLHRALGKKKLSERLEKSASLFGLSSLGSPVMTLALKENPLS